jgi:hypothetical protein
MASLHIQMANLVKAENHLNANTSHFILIIFDDSVPTSQEAQSQL